MKSLSLVTMNVVWLKRQLKACLKMLDRGIAPEAIHMVRKEMERWADGFTHPAENVEDTVDELRMNPLIPKDVPIHGLIFPS